MLQHIFIFLLMLVLKITFLKAVKEGIFLWYKYQIWCRRFAIFQEMNCIKRFIYLWLLGYWFWTNFLFIAVVSSHSFYQWSIPYFIHLLQSMYNLGSCQDYALQQFSVFTYLSSHPSILLSYLTYPSVYLCSYIAVLSLVAVKGASSHAKSLFGGM